MKQHIIEIFSKIKRLRNQGFFHIFISSSLIKIVGMLSAILFPRILTKSDFGLLSYVDNIRNYILLFNGLGIANATLRYCSLTDDCEKQKGIFLQSLRLGILIDILLVALSIIPFALIPFPFAGANRLLIALFFLPVMIFLLEDTQMYFRATFQNNYYSLSAFLYTFLMVIFQIVFGIIFNLNGVVFGRYIAVGLSLFFVIYLYLKREHFPADIQWPDKVMSIKMLKLGLIFSLTNASSLMMSYNETLLIGQVIKDENTLADYRVASFSLQATYLITQSLILFVFPYFSRNAKNKLWIWNNFKKLFVWNLIIMVPMHLLVILLAKPFLLLVFGQQYLSAIPIVRLLMIASLAQTAIRMLPGNLLVALGKEKFNLIVNLVFLAIHFLLSYLSLLKWGIRGAALALIGVYIVSGLVSLAYFYYTVKINKKEIIL